MKKIKIFLAMAAAALLAAGCSSTGSSDPKSDAAESGASTTSETLTVFAAASLEPVFTELAEKFESDNPGVQVVFNFAGSQALQEQIVEGAPADVFASANTTQMEPVVEAGLTTEDPVVFATNQLTIVTPPGNPKSVESFADLADPDILLAICAPEVPCGSATEKIESQTGITLSPVSEEQAVTDVLAKVQADEADAGLVYKTDAIDAGDTVERVDFDEAKDAVNDYPIATIADSANPELAAAWMELILGTDGQAALEQAGFGS